MKVNYTAAIHTIKSKLKLSDDDYRALLMNLTGKSSSKDMNQTEQRSVRDHLQGLAERMGVALPTRRRPLSQTAFDQVKKQTSPKERKVWALWNQLYHNGKLRDSSAASLNAWVQRTVGVSALRFANGAQLDTLIEGLKSWGERE